MGTNINIENLRYQPLNTPVWMKVLASGLIMFVFAILGCSNQSAPMQVKPVVPKFENNIKDDPIPPDILVTEKDDKKPEFPAEVPQWVSQDGGQLALSFAPKVDLLFVIDDSNSMVTVQENLRKNIDRFVQGFSRYQMIDFHIGVTTVWDMKPGFYQKRIEKGILYDNGDLRKLQTPAGESRYVSRFPGFSGALSNLLKVGTLAVRDGGPENEEIFSPLVKSLEKSVPGGINDGFLREDALLVVILVTDAEDFDKAVDPAQVARQVLAFKKGQGHKVASYFVGTRKADPDQHKDWILRVHPGYHPECFDADTIAKYEKGELGSGQICRVVGMNSADPSDCWRAKATSCKDGFGPDKIDKFILTLNQYGNAAGLSPESLLNKHVLGIMDPRFGTRLAEMGDEITARVLEKEIILTRMPTLDSQKLPNIRVRYGTRDELNRPFGSPNSGQVIPRGPKGWLLKKSRNRLSVVISGQFEYEYREGGIIHIEMIAANPTFRGGTDSAPQTKPQATQPAPSNDGGGGAGRESLPLLQ